MIVCVLHVMLHQPPALYFQTPTIGVYGYKLGNGNKFDIDATVHLYIRVVTALSG